MVVAMKIALEELGYSKVYHMQEVFERKDFEFWTAALDAKFEGKGKKFSTQEWDHLLGDCMAVTDVPSILFAPELVAAYPSAKVVLTTRDIDKWHKSCIKTVWALYANPFYSLLGRLSGAIGAPAQEMITKSHVHHWKNDCPKYGKQAFEEHNAMVRKIVPKERFLEFQVTEGWGPLCGFLGKEVPEGKPFPRANDTASFMENFSPSDGWRNWFVKNSVKVMIPSLAIAGGILWMARSRQL